MFITGPAFPLYGLFRRNGNTFEPVEFIPKQVLPSEGSSSRILQGRNGHAPSVRPPRYFEQQGNFNGVRKSVYQKSAIGESLPSGKGKGKMLDGFIPVVDSSSEDSDYQVGADQGGAMETSSNSVPRLIGDIAEENSAGKKQRIDWGSSGANGNANDKSDSLGDDLIGQGSFLVGDVVCDSKAADKEICNVRVEGPDTKQAGPET